ncbi:MAG: hypothetical protein H8D34_28810 [Chloroflexi bacterium]|nr:hypothetical protein [Chloroflexota bacterium]
MQKNTEDEITRYDDGNWYASTLGHFIGLLVDAGQDPAVCFRVIEDYEADSEGRFSRKIEMILIPNGHVGRIIVSTETKRVHKVLAKLMEKGIVE